MNKTPIKINRIVFLIASSLFAFPTIFAQSVVPNQTGAVKIDEYLNTAGVKIKIIKNENIFRQNTFAKN